MLHEDSRIFGGQAATVARGGRTAAVARDEVARALLLGGPPANAAAHLPAFGFDPRAHYRAFRARANESLPSCRVVRALACSAGLMRPNGLAFEIEGDLAGFVAERPELRSLPSIVVGVARPRPVTELHEAFESATRALETASSYGLLGVHDLGGLGLRAAVLADREVGREQVRRYLDPLETMESGEAIANSLRCYFEAGMRIKAAAHRLYVHPNTLRYRLRRFEEHAGVDLRDPACVAGVWWALQTRDLAAVATG